MAAAFFHTLVGLDCPALMFLAFQDRTPQVECTIGVPGSLRGKDSGGSTECGELEEVAGSMSTGAEVGRWKNGLLFMLCVSFWFGGESRSRN